MTLFPWIGRYAGRRGWLAACEERGTHMQRFVDRVRPYRYAAVGILVLIATMNICGH